MRTEAVRNNPLNMWLMPALFIAPAVGGLLVTCLMRGWGTECSICIQDVNQQRGTCVGSQELPGSAFPPMSHYGV